MIVHLRPYGKTELKMMTPISVVGSASQKRLATPPCYVSCTIQIGKGDY